MDHNMR